MVLDWVHREWPQDQVADEFLPYRTRQHKLSVQSGCLLWGNRMAFPPELQTRILQTLHEGHPGIVWMKALGWSYIWWPKFDQAIVNWVARCPSCQQSRPAPPAIPVWEWETPRAPWSRLHIDFAGPFMGQTFMVVVDAFSKWVELVLMASTITEAIIRAL